MGDYQGNNWKVQEEEQKEEEEERKTSSVKKVKYIGKKVECFLFIFRSNGYFTNN